MAELEPRGVVDGAFRVLRALPEVGRKHQVARLALLTGLPRPTVHRLLGQLRRSGAVDRTDGQWALSASLLGLAQQVEPLAGLRETAATVIQRLREQSGAAVSLVVPSQGSFVALEMVPGRDALPIDARSGAQMPASTAAAMVLAPSAMPAARRRPFGAAVDDQDVIAGLTCYAVPVDLPGGRKASLQIATAARWPADRLAGHVHRAAIALERRVSAL
ncbi:DNA-binding transcriptional regulator, IclR family [Actinacidiphila yanglinensis]|uniref:DNA-binding transcriptional regulator, IclR family n=1 Tax=Actinacidiphila yanglinensis TaxID=310779 RepID=A0A1H6DJ94_9ACTN|nr:helix-turn-helix domain-containing protein [Actinacidiphila yanglinensis]SEG84706.1 DNA-binding transcriptional regulator, IclR family [Actinacidiphila yanglinensis]